MPKSTKCRPLKAKGRRGREAALLGAPDLLNLYEHVVDAPSGRRHRPQPHQDLLMPCSAPTRVQIPGGFVAWHTGARSDGCRRTLICGRGALNVDDVKAAIYARRSTDEHQAASLDVQVGEARRFIEKKGWTIPEQHIYLEDAVSRAEFKKRPALIAMLNAAAEGAFDVVVTRDETRLGGDVNRTGLLIQDLLDHDVQLFYYFTGERVTLDDAMAKVMMALRNFSSELEREKISQRTREHLMTKARRGLNTGGRSYVLLPTV